MRNITIFILLVVLASCTQKNNGRDEHAHHATDKSPSPSFQNTLMLTENQVRLANITTQKITKKNVGQSIILQGKVVVNEEETQIISSRATGRIEKLLHKETGRLIEKGESLYSLYSENMLTLQQEYRLAKEQYEKLGQTESRFKSYLAAAAAKLLRYGLTSKQIDQLGQSTSVQSTVTFLSPASGTITKIDVTEGQYVTEGASLYQIANLNTLWIEAELYSTETTLAKTGDKIRVHIQGFKTDPIEAQISFLSPELRANSQIVILRAAIHNSGFLKPGMQAVIELMQSTQDALTVPTDAIIRTAQGNHVYVQTGKNTFQSRVIKTGKENFDQVEITEGIQENEIIVVTGAYLLYSELVLKGTDPLAENN